MEDDPRVRRSETKIEREEHAADFVEMCGGCWPIRPAARLHAERGYKDLVDELRIPTPERSWPKKKPQGGVPAASGTTNGPNARSHLRAAPTRGHYLCTGYIRSRAPMSHQTVDQSVAFQWRIDPEFRLGELDRVNACARRAEDEPEGKPLTVSDAFTGYETIRSR